jgi:hypothetical protein
MKRIVMIALLMGLASNLVSSVAWAAEKKVELTEQCRKHVVAYEYPEAIATCARRSNWMKTCRCLFLARRGIGCHAKIRRGHQGF